jgi:hypothetical protein
VLEHQAVFVNALRGGCEIRKRIFDVIEQHHANDFGNGREGVKLYEELLSALRDSGMAEAMKEFERRFSPLLNPDPPVRNAELGPRGERVHQDVATATQDRRRLDWGRMAILYVAAFIGTFIVAVSVLRMAATERPSVAAVTTPSAKAAELASQATTEPVSSAEQKLSAEEEKQSTP